MWWIIGTIFTLCVLVVWWLRESQTEQAKGDQLRQHIAETQEEIMNLALVRQKSPAKDALVVEAICASLLVSLHNSCAELLAWMRNRAITHADMLEVDAFSLETAVQLCWVENYFLSVGVHGLQPSEMLSESGTEAT